MRSINLRLPALLVVIYGLGEQALAQVNLGTAAPFGIIASSAITNTGATIVNGQLGIYPGTESSITGFPPGIAGVVNANNGVADQARQDAQTAYQAAASLASTGQTGQDLGGQILVAGTYTASSSVGLTGTLTLDGGNNPDALFVFQIGSTLTTATSSSVVLINGAQACNVFWQVGSSATLGTSTAFNGNILALTSISLNEGVTVAGGLYALNGAVTLINDRVTAQRTCATQPAATTSSVLIVTSAVLPSSASIPEDDMTATEDDITTALPEDDITTTPPENDITTTIPAADITATLSGSDIAIPLSRSDAETTLSGTDSSTTLAEIRFITTLPGDKTSTALLATMSTNKPTLDSSHLSSHEPLFISISSYAPTRSSEPLPELYSVPISIEVEPSRSATQAPSSTSFLPGVTSESNMSWITRTDYASSRPALTSTTQARVTTINGTPCTTLSYYEPTCSCTKTAVVPLVFMSAPSPESATIKLTTVDGVPCTTTQYYESICDCIRTSNVPIQVVSATASIVTVIDNVPCITSKYYEATCGCVKTATVPVRIASVGDTVTAITADAKAAQNLSSCMSACIEPYLPAATVTFTTTRPCSATPRYRM